MAIYSKQWCDLYNSDITPNYDIESVASLIFSGSYRPISCDGFGFKAIGKRTDGVLEFYFKNHIGIMSPPSLDSADWINMDEMLQKERDEIQNNGD